MFHNLNYSNFFIGIGNEDYEIIFVVGYTKVALKGISWLGGSRIINRVITVARIIIIARILTPSQLGIFAIASIVLTLVEIVTETGINVFLIQKKDNTDDYINTAWIISILRGILISSVILVGSPFIASFFSTPDALFLLQLISTIPFMRGFINPSVVNFSKYLQFDKEFYFRSFIIFFDTFFTIIFTLIFQSPVGIILGLLTASILEVIISFVAIKPTPRFAFKKSYFQEILSKGKWVTVGGIFNYLFENMDDIVVGKLLGTTSLGIYNTAYRISLLPLTEISDVITKVAFPVYVKIVDEKERLQKAFIKALTAVTVLVVPIGVLFLVFPKEIIFFTLGSQWLEATSVLQVLAIFGVIRAIISVPNGLFWALKRQKIVTQINLFSFIFLALTIVFFVNYYNTVGAAYSALSATFLVTPLVVYHTAKVLRS